MRAEMVSPDELNVHNQKGKEDQLKLLMNDPVIEVIHYGIEKGLLACKDLLETTLNQKISIRMVDYQLVNAKEFLSSRLSSTVTTFSFEGIEKSGKQLFIVDKTMLESVYFNLKGSNQDQELTNEQLNQIFNYLEDGVKLFFRRFSEELNVKVSIKSNSINYWNIKEDKLKDIELDELFEIKIYEVKIEDTSFFMMHLSDRSFMEYAYSELRISSNDHLFFEELVDETNFSTNESPVLGRLHSQLRDVKKPLFSNFEETVEVEGNHNLDLLYDVPLEISVVLGKTKRSIREILEINTGKIIELEKYADDPLEIYCNGKMIAEGEVVVVGENFGVRVTKLHQNGLKKIDEKR